LFVIILIGYIILKKTSYGHLMKHGLKARSNISIT